MRTRVKICGITSVEDALTAVSLGADALGFVFWPRSGRYLSPAAAGDIIQRLPPMITTIAVVVDPSLDEIEAIIRQSGVDLVQFHGQEPAQFCAQCSRPYVKSIRVQSAGDAAQVEEAHPYARAFLLDTYKKGLPGGTGESFDWDLIPPDFGRPVILAGGLSADNVGEAIAAVRPFAVDVSGGVEQVPGVKDPAKVEQFLNEVKRVSATQ